MSLDLNGDRYRRAAKMMLHALVLGDAHSWSGVAYVWAARLTMNERAAVAMAAMFSLPEEAATIAGRRTIGYGAPHPSFIDPLSEAQIWAASASVAELDAYLVAAFSALPRHKQRQFADYAGKVAH